MRDGRGEFAGWFMASSLANSPIMLALGRGGRIPFESPGPKRRGICLINVSEARNANNLKSVFYLPAKNVQ